MIPSDGARGWARYSVEIYQPPQVDPVFRLGGEETSYTFPTFSPDGRWMAYVEDNIKGYTGLAHVRLVSTDWQVDRPLTGEFETGKLSGPHLIHLSWSPDSRWLAFEYRSWGLEFNDTYIVNIGTTETYKVGTAIESLRWSPQDSTWLAFIKAGGLYLASVGDLGHPLRVNLPHSLTPLSLAWAPDGERIVSCSDMGLVVVNVAALSGEWVSTGFFRCGNLAWSPDSRWLVSYGGENVGINGAFFYKVGEWNAARWQAVGPIRSGGWGGDALFLGEEEVDDEAGKKIGDQLIAISVEGHEKYILWSSKDVGLPERIKGKLGLERIAWYVAVQP